MAEFIGNITVDVTDVYNQAGPSADLNAITATLPQSTSVIETITGVFFDGTIREVVITTADAAWLKKATIYQTVFMLEQEILARQSVSHLTQDGVSVTAPDALTFVLAPLAKRALANCSWARSGTLKVTVQETTPVSSFLTDDNHAWAPMGAA